MSWWRGASRRGLARRRGEPFLRGSRRCEGGFELGCELRCMVCAGVCKGGEPFLRGSRKCVGNTLPHTAATHPPPDIPYQTSPTRHPLPATSLEPPPSRHLPPPSLRRCCTTSSLPRRPSRLASTCSRYASRHCPSCPATATSSPLPRYAAGTPRAIDRVAFIYDAATAPHSPHPRCPTPHSLATPSSVHARTHRPSN